MMLSIIILIVFLSASILLAVTQTGLKNPFLPMFTDQAPLLARKPGQV